MGYGTFFYLSATILILLAWGTWSLYRSGRMSPAWRSRTVNGALVLLGLLVPLVAAEGYFFFFVDTTDSAMITLSNRRWIERHLPHPLGNPRGRTGPSENAETRPPLVIAVVGDSITYGQGVKRDQNLYTSILERELRARGLPAAVYNISYPGWDTIDELAVLRRLFERGAKFSIVVLGFCLNDIAPHIPATPEYNKVVAPLTAPPAVLSRLLSRSFVASFFYFRYVNLMPSVVKWGETLTDAYRSPETFRALGEQLEAIKQLTEAHQVPLLVLTFPDTSNPLR